jgi:hypothetical protein
MSKWVIFRNNQVFKLASTDAIKDSFVEAAGGGSDTVAKTVTDTQWDDISWGIKDCTLSNDAISITDKVLEQASDITAEQKLASEKACFQEEIDNQIALIDAYLENNTSTDWTNYKANLNSIDVSTVTFPVDSFQKWFNSQSGFSSKSILELP